MGRNRRPSPIAVAVVVVFIFIALTTSQVDSSRYQAVFLDNGQVYFGKLHGYYGDRPYLTDVYYVRGAQSGGEDAASNENQELVRLGNEIHNPENIIILNKPAILFVENLQEDSSVIELINQDKSRSE